MPSTTSRSSRAPAACCDPPRRLRCWPRSLDRTPRRASSVSIRASSSGVVDHYTHGTSVPKLHVISGYRPTSAGSFHATARALDFRIDGVSNEDLVAFCRSLPDTGCGYYPNSSFIHLDVRDAGAGHVTWIDASGPGESPRYVSAWPPPRAPHTPAADADLLEKLGLADVPADDHPADVQPTAEIPPPPAEPADPRSATLTPSAADSGTATQ